MHRQPPLVFRQSGFDESDPGCSIVDFAEEYQQILHGRQGSEECFQEQVCLCCRFKVIINNSCSTGSHPLLKQPVSLYTPWLNSNP